MGTFFSQSVHFAPGKHKFRLPLSGRHPEFNYPTNLSKSDCEMLHSSKLLFCPKKLHDNNLLIVSSTDNFIKMGYLIYQQSQNAENQLNFRQLFTGVHFSRFDLEKF
jgi:hypothetical protein